MGLSVIGAGFGRTGTLSLKVALEMLGFSPCYHMLEVLEHPAHIPVWMSAAQGERVDWEEVFGKYQAAVDWPTAYFWRDLAERYPVAKVILTVRDPEQWYDSVFNTIYRSLSASGDEEDPTRQAQRSMARTVVLDRIFGGKFDERAHAIGVYQRHVGEVKRTIPPDRLLVYDVAEGWKPLCSFLDRPVPTDTFPRVNTTAEFKTRRFSP